MVLLPKFCDHLMASAAQAFHARRRAYPHLTVTDTQFAWATVATRPIAVRQPMPRRATLRRIKIAHARVLFGLTCLLLLLALLLSQPAAVGSAPYLTYDKVSSLQAAPLSIEPHASGAAPCSMLATALGLCKP